MELVRRRVEASELGERINVPTATAVRWMKVLEREGMIDRAVLADDPTQYTIGLTEKALLAMDGYFSAGP
jgi:DNA-binding MarR family transcriptional regulator